MPSYQIEVLDHMYILEDFFFLGFLVFFFFFLGGMIKGMGLD